MTSSQLNPKIDIGKGLYVKVVDEEDNLEELVQATKKAQEESPFGDEVFDYDHMSYYLSHFQRGDYDKLIGFTVRNKEEEIVGILFAAKGEEHFFFKRSYAVELVWWVREDSRRTRAPLELLKLYEEWARWQGCKHIIASHFSDGKNMEPLYTKKGFKKVEVSFIKEL